jgi:hypothetical protein
MNDEQVFCIRCSFCDVVGTEGNPWSGGWSRDSGKLLYRLYGCKNHKELVDMCLKKLEEDKL